MSQRTLVALADGGTVDMVATLAPNAGTVAANVERTFAAFDCSGIRVDELTVEHQPPDKVRVRGVKHIDPDLDDDFESFTNETRTRMAARREFP